MARASIEDLLRAGAHFGHLTSRWNPKMAPYIFMQRNGIHILDLKQTQALLDEAAAAAARFASRGRPVLFVGTKKQAQSVVREEAERAGMPFVVDRWLGGMLTNFATMRGGIRRMETLRREDTDGTAAHLKKKERLMRSRELEKLERVLGGISEMGKLPGALFVVDVKREHIAVDEARKLNIPVIALVDSNVDPDLVDFPVPANDDAMKSVALFTKVIADAIIEGRQAGLAERDEAAVEAATRAAEAAELADKGEDADGTTTQLKKKERLMRSRELEKLDRVLGGIADMGKLPGAVFVVDVKREHIAVDEARKLNIPIIALVDSNVDPDLVDFPVPANDDAMKSVALFTKVIADAIIEGQKAGAVERDAAVAEAQSRAADEAKADAVEAEAEAAEPVTTMADAEAAAKTEAAAARSAS